MNYTTKVGVPTVHITKKKSRLKIYNGNIVFLNDGDNFEFEIHNPTTKSVLAKIKIDGNYISNSGVVIKPGQRIYLERFLDTNNKFEFCTYPVDDNDENRSAIEFNGDIRVEFYNEQTSNPHYNTLINNTGAQWTTITTGSPYYGDITFTTNNTGVSTFTTTSNTYYSSNLIETGRVDKGETSNQSFANSYENFAYVVSKYYEFKILPLMNKNMTSDEIRKYCTECGTKVKKNFKFCPSCGNKI